MHEDLIGYQFVDEFGNTLEVTGPVEWSDQYVQCECKEHEYRTVRNIGLLRQHRALNASQETTSTLEEEAQEPSTSSEGTTGS